MSNLKFFPLSLSSLSNWWLLFLYFAPFGRKKPRRKCTMITAILNDHHKVRQQLAETLMNAFQLQFLFLFRAWANNVVASKAETDDVSFWIRLADGMVYSALVLPICASGLLSRRRGRKRIKVEADEKDEGEEEEGEGENRLVVGQRSLNKFKRIWTQQIVRLARKNVLNSFTLKARSSRACNFVQFWMLQ